MVRARTAIVALLILGGLFAAAPWIGCVGIPSYVALRVDPRVLRDCTFGDPAFSYQRGFGLPGFTGPYWGNLLVGIGYLIAALVVARTRRAI